LAIYVADLQTQQLRHIIAGYALPITCMDWSPDKPNLLVCASTDKTVSVWDVETESTLYTLSLDSPPILVQWCRGDPEKIAIASENGTVRLWQPVASNSLVSRDFNFSKVAVLRWNVKIACLLAAGHADCSITIYNSASQSPHRIKCADSKYGGHTDGVVDLQWDPLSDNYLIAAFGSGLMGLFDTDKQVQVRAFDKSPGGCRCLEWLPTSPGSFVAASDKHGSVRQWNVSQNAPEKSFKVGNSGVHSLRMLPGGDRALVANVDGQVGVYHLKKKVWVQKLLVGHTQTIFACSFNPTHKDMLATCSYDGSVKLWDVAHMKLLSSVDLAAGLGAKTEHQVCCYDLHWAPNGQRCIVAASNGSLPSSLPPFLPSSLPPFLPSSLPPFLPSFLPPFLSVCLFPPPSLPPFLPSSLSPFHCVCLSCQPSLSMAACIPFFPPHHMHLCSLHAEYPMHVSCMCACVLVRVRA